MFILVHSGNELLACDNEVTAYPTHEKAYIAMLEQFDGTAADEGITLQPELSVGDVYCCDVDGTDIRRVGYIADEEAFLSDKELKWAILEIPGVFIPQNVADDFRRDVGDAMAMYADEDRVDWFDADDLCHDVCNTLEYYLREE